MPEISPLDLAEIERLNADPGEAVVNEATQMVVTPEQQRDFRLAQIAGSYVKDDGKPLTKDELLATVAAQKAAATDDVGIDSPPVVVVP